MDSKTDIPPSLAPKMLAMMKAIDELKTGLSPIVSKPHHEVLAKLDHLERAKIHIMESYTLNALFWALIKLSSDSDAEQLEKDIKTELGRIKGVQQRVAELEARASMQRIDQAAARRFINHGLGTSGKRKKKSSIAKEEEVSTVQMPKKRSKLQDDINSSWQ
ncbi:nuclear nucleic acid-binding protein C1D [Hyalella azteca]|uniref:Nuclear nucleic acid-binding protein C1D n=1 Tax=Hyalella azteca TaxID=294128 RepID=A0A8B7N9R9_HYAAZ|nr:nuclear nucleic acid-binding protein C1D [Hyalella azteca]XP_047740711.1 nuclear nucleic acid-binding protein C1D [Hyalella azteca]